MSLTLCSSVKSQLITLHGLVRQFLQDRQEGVRRTTPIPDISPTLESVFKELKNICQLFSQSQNTFLGDTSFFQKHEIYFTQSLCTCNNVVTM